MQLKHGSYEANPPFVPALLTATAQHALSLLQEAEAAGAALSFCVLVPGWQEVQGWQLMNSSGFLRKSLVVAAADHGEITLLDTCQYVFLGLCGCDQMVGASREIKSKQLLAHITIAGHGCSRPR
jgi:hypothetical protein